MDRDKFLNKITEIGTTEDEVARRTLLAELSDEVSQVFDNNEALANENAKYVEDNEKLRSANMQLFLRVGEKTSDDVKKEQKIEEEKEPRKFENLFDDKGNLK